MSPFFFAFYPFIPFIVALSLEDLGQLLHDGVSRLDRSRVAAHVFRPQTTVDGGPHGVLDGLGLGREVEGVPEHHGDGEDGAERVHYTLARDIRGGACQLVC